jgi:SAM-dependent methyltransferase
LDVNAGMLAVARSLPPDDNTASIHWCQASALGLPFVNHAFDVVLCQLGLQFFPDRAAALREFHRVLRRGGRVGVSVFAAIEHNPATHALADALDRHLGQDASRVKRHEHSLSDVAELQGLFAATDFVDTRVETVTREVEFASAPDYIRVQASATPLAAVFARLDRSAHEHLVSLLQADVDLRFASYGHGVRFTFPQEVHVVQATT